LQHCTHFGQRARFGQFARLLQVADWLPLAVARDSLFKRAVVDESGSFKRAFGGRDELFRRANFIREGFCYDDVSHCGSRLHRDAAAVRLGGMFAHSFGPFLFLHTTGTGQGTGVRLQAHSFASCETETHFPRKDTSPWPKVTAHKL
jgi:hypothetical protein